MKTYSTKEILSDPSNMKVWLYGQTLSKILEGEFEGIKLTPKVMESDFVKAAYGGKSWRKDYGVHLRMVIENPEFTIQLNALDKNTVDLFLITVHDKGNGLGTTLMQLLTIIADATDTNISLVPVAINSSDDVKVADKLAKRLRVWYSNLGFTENKSTPEMNYQSQEV